MLGANTGTGYGVLGRAKSGTAVAGNAAGSGTGIYGQGATGIQGQGTGYGYGVYGTSAAANGFGLAGVSLGSGTGVYGSSIGGYGVDAESEYGFALQASSVYSNAIVSNSTSGYGVFAYDSNFAAVVGSSSSGIGVLGTGVYGVVGEPPTTGAGASFYGAGANSGNVFVVVEGQLQCGSANQLIRTKRHQEVQAYATADTADTSEDVGDAHLTNGTAHVALDPLFAGSIDARKSYEVFITPDGDTHGLYVASKSPTGFTVREWQNGHSTVDFDYRVVATPVEREPPIAYVRRAPAPR